MVNEQKFEIIEINGKDIRKIKNQMQTEVEKNSVIDLASHYPAEIVDDNEARYRSILSTIPDHILVQDLNLKYLMVINPPVGFSEQDIIGKTDSDLLSQGDAENLSIIKKRVIINNIPEKILLSFISSDGNMAIDLGPRNYF